MRLLDAVAPIAALAIVASPTDAQSSGGQSLSGFVQDARGAPVVLAEVSLRGTARQTRTDSLGAFHFEMLEPGSVVVAVRRMGFQPRDVSVVIPQSLDVLRVVLDESAAPLATVVVDEKHKKYMDGFERRRRSGSGLFVTRDQIAARNPTRLSDMLRGMPGIQISARSGVRGNALRFTGTTMMKRDCAPEYWVDGQRAHDADIDEFPPGDVEGIELYAGPATTPLQFSAFGPVTSCGTVVIWTRPPG